MTVEVYTNMSKNTNYSIDMQNGVYLMSRTGGSQNNSFLKGYVENGVLHEIYTYSSGMVTYSNGTLTVNCPSSVTSTHDLYFFKMS